jgi:hypothetical protein
VKPLPETDELQFLLGPLERLRRAGKSRGSATFSSAVMVGMRWKDWKTMPMR